MAHEARRGLAAPVHRPCGKEGFSRHVDLAELPHMTVESRIEALSGITWKLHGDRGHG
jgi:hypothetical protein